MLQCQIRQQLRCQPGRLQTYRTRCKPGKAAQDGTDQIDDGTRANTHVKLLSSHLASSVVPLWFQHAAMLPTAIGNANGSRSRLANRAATNADWIAVVRPSCKRGLTDARKPRHVK